MFYRALEEDIATAWTKRPAAFVIARNNILSRHIGDSPNRPALGFWKTFFQFQSEGDVGNFEILREKFRNFSNFFPLLNYFLILILITN